MSVQPSLPGRRVSAPVPVLSGCRVLLTAQRRSEELAAALERRGAQVDRAPTLGFLVGGDRHELLRRTQNLIDVAADVVVVTTATGFRSWLDTAEAAGLGERLLGALAGVRLVARGHKATAALQAVGLVVDWVAESETTAEITELLLGEGVDGVRIAVQHHGGSATTMDEALAAAGAQLLGLDPYRWGPPPEPAAVARSAQALVHGDYDAVLFTSAPAAAAWLASLKAAGADAVVRDRVTHGTLLLAAVGPVTAEPLAYAGFLAHRPVRARLGSLARLAISELGDERHALRTPRGSLRVRAAAVTLDHRLVPLSPGGLAVLRRLAATPGHVVTREELLAVLPGESSDPHTAEVAVARLRESLRHCGGDARLVRTVVKRGYVLAAG